MRLKHRHQDVAPGDKRWRVTPFGLVLLAGIPACFVIGALTGAFVFFAAGTFLVCVGCAGYFASLPSPWRSRGDEKGRTVDPLGNVIQPPGDE